MLEIRRWLPARLDTDTPSQPGLRCTREETCTLQTCLAGAGDPYGLCQSTTAVSTESVAALSRSSRVYKAGGRFTSVSKNMIATQVERTGQEPDTPSLSRPRVFVS